MKFIRRLRYVLRRAHEARAMEEEMEFHRAMLEQDSAGAKMGNTLCASEDARGVWIATWLESLIQDLRYAIRALLREPGFTLTALLALVLGIGLNMSLFTVFGITLRPWPVRDAARVVSLLTVGGPAQFGGFSVPEAKHLNANSRTLEGAVAWRVERVNLDRQSDGANSRCGFVSGNYFGVLGVSMRLGRGLTESEDLPNAPQAIAVLSYRVWKNRYAMDTNIVGRRITIEDIPFTVVGVASEESADATFGNEELWAPLSSLTVAHPGVAGYAQTLNNPHWCCSFMAGRMAPGVTRAQVNAELTALDKRYKIGIGEKPQQIESFGTAFLDRPDDKRGKVIPVLGLMFGAVLAVLLLACANVSNLLLARGAARQSEIGVRLSLGASRMRVVRQLMTENFLLAGIASCISVGVAWVFPGYLVHSLAGAPEYIRLRPDAVVLECSIALAFITACIFGLVPALRTTRTSVHNSMKGQGRTFEPRFPLRSILLGTQVAVSVLLMVSAGLLVRGLRAAQSHDPGFRIDGVSMALVDLPVNGMSGARWRQTFQDFERRLPDVGFAAAPPFANGTTRTSLAIPGRHSGAILIQFVNGPYFNVLGIPLIEGRAFVPEDRAGNVVIVNEAAARQFWPQGHATGSVAFVNGKPSQVVGVARDAELYGIGQLDPVFFLPFQGGDPAVMLAPAPASLLNDRVRGVVLPVEPHAVIQVTPLSAQLDRTLRSAHTAAQLGGGVGLLALLLATLGVYGVISYSVEQRRRELGIRMALGARPSQVVQFVLRLNSWPLLVGLIVGIGSSLACGKLLRTLLFGIAPLDWAAYAGALGLLMLAGIAACFVPAFRSARIDPLESLRYE